MNESKQFIEEISNLNRAVHEHEQRIKELKAALRWVVDVNPEITRERIREHAIAVLMHDHIEHGKGWV